MFMTKRSNTIMRTTSSHRFNEIPMIPIREPCTKDDSKNLLWKEQKDQDTPKEK